MFVRWLTSGAGHLSRFGRFIKKSPGILVRFPGFIWNYRKRIALLVLIPLIIWGAGASAYTFILPVKMKQELNTRQEGPKAGILAVYGFLKRNLFSSAIDEDDLPQKIRAMRVRHEMLSPEILVSGTVTYREKVAIVSRTGGRIEKFFVAEGDRIQLGAPLVQMERLPLEIKLKQDKAALQAAYSEYRLAKEKYSVARNQVEIKHKNIRKQRTKVKMLQARMRKVRATYEGNKLLYKQGGVSREELEKIRTEVLSREAEYLMSRRELEISQVGFRNRDLKKRGYRTSKRTGKLVESQIKANTGIQRAEVDVARARHQSAKAALSSTITLLRETMIKSPISGVVAERYKSVGEEVTAGGGGSNQTIMLLVMIDEVFIKFNVREAELVRLVKGNPVEIAPDVYKGKIFKGLIHVVKPVIDQETHAIQVKALVKNTTRELKPGMFVRGKIITGPAAPALLVPTNALVPREGNRAWVFLLRKGKVFRAEVETGEQMGERVLINKGLAKNDVVLLENLSRLRDGIAARPVFDIAAAQ